MRTSLGQDYNQMMWSSLEPLLSAGDLEVTIEVVGGRPNRRGWWKRMFERTLPALHARSRLTVECHAGPCELSGHEGGIIALTLFPDGCWIATASEDKSIVLWNALDGTAVRDWVVHYHHEVVTRTTLVFSPNSQQLASCGWRDGRIAIWDVVDGRRLATLYDTFDETDDVTARVAVVPDSTCAWSSDGAMLATVSHRDESEGVARIWDTRTYKQLSPIPSRPGYTGPISSPDGLWWAVIYEGLVQVIGAIDKNDSPLAVPCHAISAARGLNACSFDPASMRIAAAYKEGKLCVWNLRSGKELLLKRQQTRLT
ncbi:WD40-repeat-containing domain protein [Dichomitus squalens]|uniref:WD40-repeat-containing domain protein n=1 Tax=Dichomitus squalens TaxID=114155 RepID=A0A4Q9Q306_9APHY|nr:WD40-repeat-containing domain protein [Dichomitus squalens]